MENTFNGWIGILNSEMGDTVVTGLRTFAAVLMKKPLQIPVYSGF
jgi:hypothetical protein